jgi:alkylation response protein AidB-like acyl-CoA dehydrogenase
LGTGSGSVIAVTAAPEDELDLTLHASSNETATIFSDDAARETAVIYAATAVGAASRLLELGVDYAKEREQFGSPIGSFQAVKHHLANALLAVEQAETAVIWASLTDDEAYRPALFAIEKSIAAAELIIQVFGGIGFTWELGLHYYLRHMLFTREIVVGLKDRV